MTDAHGWRPISTAPRDGTWMLSWSKGAVAPQVIAWSPRFDDWIEDDNKLWSGLPTHWQPLPPPPGKEGGEGG